MVVMLLNDVRGAVNAVDKHINDPWSIEDIWLIVAWHYAIKNGRRVRPSTSTRII